MGNCVGVCGIRGKESEEVVFMHEPALPHTVPSHEEDHCDHAELESALAKDIGYRRQVFQSLTIPQPFPSLPPRPESIPFIVPCLTSTDALYDGLDFWTYPERRGWVVHVKDKQCHMFCSPGLCRGPASRYVRGVDPIDLYLPLPMFSRTDGSPVTGASKAAFLQSWLFFGVLAEVSRTCGLTINIPDEFVVGDGRAVSTAALNGLAGRWFSSLSSEQVGDKAYMERILGMLRHVSLLLNEELVDREDLKPVYEYTPGEMRVFHSIDTLLRILGLHLLLHVYSPGFTAPEEDGWGKERIAVNITWAERRVEGLDKLTDMVWDEMAIRGWCESELSLLATDELPFASLLDRPRARDHSKCGDVVCSAYQTDEATYTTVHVDDNCVCESVQVPTDGLVEHLAKDKVPAVIVAEDLGVQVVCSDDYSYIALSHVWADGLGNPVANALPRCQLQRLRTYVDGLHRLHSTASPPGPVAFWMDTLCIPVDPNAKALRKKAIQLLGKTFNEASAVLVLDRELEIVDAVPAPFLELGLRILCSGWIKRLWTLQEAALASEAHGEEKLYFQMRDRPFLYQKYDRHRIAAHALGGHTTELQTEEREILCETGVILLLGEQIPSVRAMRSTRPGWSQFSAVRDALEHRTTSKAEDVPVCVASLVGKDVAPILAAPDEQHRLAAFYLLMRAIPDRVLWVDRIAKLGIAPFRWAPVSLPACPMSTFRSADDAVCDARGLHVCHRGFIVDVTRARERHEALPPRFRLVSETGEVDAPYGILRPALTPARVPLEPDMKVAIMIRPHIILMEPNAAVVRLEGQVDVDAEIVGTIIAYMFFTEAPEGAPGPRDSDTLLHCNATAAEQKWCIT